MTRPGSICQQALAIKRKIKDREGEGANLTNLGNVYRHLGQYDQARKALEEGLKIGQEVGVRKTSGGRRLIWELSK